MTLKQEIFLGTATFISTTISGVFLIDLFIGILTYSSARLFYHYFGESIKNFIDKIKAKLSEKKAKLFKKS